MDFLNKEEKNLEIKETESHENIASSDSSAPARKSPSHSENLMQREHESVDDFEHLEPESSPLKELTEPVISAVTEPVKSMSDNLSMLVDMSAEKLPTNQSLLDMEFGGTAASSAAATASKVVTDSGSSLDDMFADHTEKQDIAEKDIMQPMISSLNVAPPDLHKAATEPSFHHLSDTSLDDQFTHEYNAGGMSDKIQFESGIDLSDLMDNKKTEEEKMHLPKAKEELEAVYSGIEPKSTLPKVADVSEDSFVMAEKEDEIASAPTPEPDEPEEEEPPVPLPKDYDEEPVKKVETAPPAPKKAPPPVVSHTHEDDVEIAACDLSGLCAWFNPDSLPPAVGQLVYWRDPKKSGLVFGTILVVLLSLTVFSLISVVAYLSLLVLIGTIIFRIYKSILQAVQKTEDGHPFKDLLEADIALTQEKVQEVTELAVNHVNGVASELRRLFLVEDLVDSIKFLVLLWCLTYVGAWFNGLTLIIIAFVGAFTLPKVYENNKAQIDQYLDLARSKMADVSNKVKAAVPLGKKDKEQ